MYFPFSAPSCGEITIDKLSAGQLSDIGSEIIVVTHGYMSDRKHRSIVSIGNGKFLKKKLIFKSS